MISPNFERLAADGVRYANCVSSSPVCCPYRATVQTGLYPHQHEVRLNQSPWRGIYDGRYIYAIKGAEDSWEPISLIDTVADPYDLQNLAEDPAHAETPARLQNALERELFRTSDYEFLQRTDMMAEHGVVFFGERYR
ncbi:MAG: sulfatase-like hydrolase/transferase [Planctomycetes bacterium]|nr:sulfatase-like hydrolase/transferase [Planctomycetota bacterium]